MWIVKLSNNQRHSAWDSEDEALHQAEVLQYNGYTIDDKPRNCSPSEFVEYDETVICRNGHYYV